MIGTFNFHLKLSTLFRKAGRASLVILVLALSAGWVSPAAPALGAGPGPGLILTESRFYIEASLPHQTLCAGQKYSVKASVHVEETLNNGGSFHTFPWVNIPVDAESSDTSIAAIDPASQIFITPGHHVSLESPNQITFNLQAIKAGPAAVFLSAKLPVKSGARGNRTLAMSAVPFEIRNCAYDVTVIYWWELANDFIKWWTSGVLKTRITATDPEYYGGDGSLDFLLSQYDIACGQMNTLDIPTHVSAHYDPDNNKLAITFTSQDTGDAVTTCPNSALMSPIGVTVPSGPWAGIPVLFPPEGGTKTIQMGGGSGLPPAKVTITVKPVDATGAK